MLRKVLIFVAIVLLAVACRPGLPAKGSGEYASAIKAFYVGLAAMQAADDQRARTELTRATEIAADEPAAWANLGILQMRQKDLDAAARSFEKARGLAADNGQVLRNIYVLDTQKGDFDAGIATLKKAIALDAADVRSQFALAREYERQNNDADAISAYTAVAAARPENLPVKLEIARLLAKQGDAEKLRVIFSQIAARSPEWEPEIRQQFTTLQASANGGNVREVSQNIAFFRNVLLRLPQFRAEIADVRFDDTIIGEPFSKPLKLPVPDFLPAPPDEKLTFTAEPVANETARWSKAVFLDGDSAPAIAWAGDNEIHIGDKTLPVAASNDLQTIDIDYNFKNDFISVGNKGLTFYDDNFQDITAKTKLPAAILNRKYLKAFTFDVESDGDLDLVLAAETGPPVVLQNNADGTFADIKQFTEIDGLKDFTIGDIDEDGDVDVATVDAKGTLRVYQNERGGQYTLRQSPTAERVNSITIADINGDGKLDLNIWQGNENFLRVSDKGDGKTWEIAKIVCPQQATFLDPATLGGNKWLIADLDNNGSNDMAVGGLVWQSTTNGDLTAAAKSSDVDILSSKHLTISDVADLNGDGRLDLVGLDADGKPAKFINSGSKNYGWQVIRPRSARAEGDQRVNSFGIGGEMEIRSGLLAQKRVITSPQVHFGLGEQTSTDLLRIVWGNGFVQAEFDLAKDESVLVKQRLTGSCPHLFAWNGKEFKFVKDSAPLGTSLGLRLSDKETLPVTATEEWYKIPGESLVPRDGFYEIRITDELWESYYVDHYALMVVDHLADTEIYANELYPVPSPLKLYSTATPRPFASAVDDHGFDVSGTVANLDENYLGNFEKARYQGVTAEHFVELELPSDAPTDVPLEIIADGWLHPADTSLNVAISQTSYPQPKTLSLDVQEPDGKWRTVADDFGVPASKFKTVVVDLPAGTRRCRLRTNSEVYWDRLAWAVPESGRTNEITRLELAQAELQFHGFSAVSRKDDLSPEIADHDTIATTTQRWRTIEGYYTRYGDIRELLSHTDDRYALVASGDEMVLRFAELPPVRAGWKRDFIIVGDGWIKEGDYNNVFSKTVLPLPTHASNDYTRVPTRLEDDPVYQKHASDWLNFHTRYVAPDQFRNAVRGK